MKITWQMELSDSEYVALQRIVAPFKPHAAQMLDFAFAAIDMHAAVPCVFPAVPDEQDGDTQEEIANLRVFDRMIALGLIYMSTEADRHGVLHSAIVDHFDWLWKSQPRMGKPEFGAIRAYAISCLPFDVSLADLDERFSVYAVRAFFEAGHGHIDLASPADNRTIVLANRWTTYEDHLVAKWQGSIGDDMAVDSLSSALKREHCELWSAAGRQCQMYDPERLEHVAGLRLYLDYLDMCCRSAMAFGPE